MSEQSTILWRDQELPETSMCPEPIVVPYGDYIGLIAENDALLGQLATVTTERDKYKRMYVESDTHAGDLADETLRLIEERDEWERVADANATAWLKERNKLMTLLARCNMYPLPRDLHDLIDELLGED